MPEKSGWPSAVRGVGLTGRSGSLWGASCAAAGMAASENSAAARITLTPYLAKRAFMFAPSIISVEIADSDRSPVAADEVPT